MRYCCPFLIAALLIASFLQPAFADTASSTSFKIERGVVDIGGGSATSTGFDLKSSIGQPGTGISTSTSFILRGGFLYFAVPTTTVTTTPPAPTPTPSPLSGGGGGGTGYYLLPFFKRGEVIAPEVIKVCDFSKDGRCNITDLSIILYYYERTGPSVALYDLNRNGAVDFPDISIMIYYWTG